MTSPRDDNVPSAALARTQMQYPAMLASSRLYFGRSANPVVPRGGGGSSRSRRALRVRTSFLRDALLLGQRFTLISLTISCEIVGNPTVLITSRLPVAPRLRCRQPAGSY